MSTHGLKESDLQLLRSFVGICSRNPDILYLPDLEFYRRYLESLGASIPPKSGKCASDEPLVDESESEESELELDNANVIEPDEKVADLPNGDESIEVTPEMADQANEKRIAAAKACSEGNLDLAISLYSEAICLNPGSALLHAKRAGVLVQLKRPLAAIRDCDIAVRVNENSALAYKYRGKAKGLLGMWEEAHHDLCMATKLDCDEEAIKWLKEVEPNAAKVAEHKRNKERRRQEKADKARQAKQQKKTAEKDTPAADDEIPLPGSMPDFLGGLMSDPEILQMMQDPDLASALKDGMSNPANLLKHMGNPKFAALLEKLKNKFGGAFPASSSSSSQPKNTAAPDFGATKGPTVDDVD